MAPLPHYIDVDLKRNTQFKLPSITQNDTDVTFIIRLSDNGQASDALLDNFTTITLTSVRPKDKKAFYVAGEKVAGTNEVSFNLGTSELANTGKVEASVQLYSADGRMSTAHFTYEVRKDHTGEYVPSENEATLIETVLIDGPRVLSEAEAATLAATIATTNLEIDKATALEEMSTATQGANTAATNADTERVRMVNEVTQVVTDVEGLTTYIQDDFLVNTAQAISDMDLVVQENATVASDAKTTAEGVEAQFNLITSEGPVQSVNGQTGIIEGLALQSELNETNATLAEMVIKQPVSITEFGAHPTKTPLENTLAIQSAVDSFANDENERTLLVPSGMTFYVAYGIKIAKRFKLQIEGTLIMAGKRTSLLTAITTTGSNQLTVADGSIFHVGEKIGVIDDNRGVQNTSPRKVSESAKILSIVGNVITVEGNFLYEYTPNANGFVTSANSILNCGPTSGKIEIWGKGTVDGNMVNQTDFEPLRIGQSGIEDTDACSCIVADNIGTFKMRKVEVKNAVLHNLALLSINKVNVLHNNIHHAHDKNILGKAISSGDISHNNCSDSVHEDGIIFYSNCHRVNLADNKCNNNKRYGIKVNDNQNYHILSNNELSGNLMNLDFNGNYSTIDNAMCVGGGTGGNYGGVVSGIGNTINNLTIKDVNANVAALSIGGSDHIFNNLKLSNAVKSAVQNGVYLNCPRVIINGLAVGGFNIGIRAFNVAVNSVVSNAILKNNTINKDFNATAAITSSNIVEIA